MKYKTYWKDMGKALTKSWGRFFSIFSLMALGSLTLVGLKATLLTWKDCTSLYSRT